MTLHACASAPKLKIREQGRGQKSEDRTVSLGHFDGTDRQR